MDKMQKEGKSPGQILVSLRARRRRSGGLGPGKTAVYNFLSGQTHQRGAVETRGRKSKIPADLVPVAMAKRRKLIKDAGNEWLVMWGDVHAETKKALKANGSLKRAKDMPSEDWLARQIRASTDMRARPPKKRIAHQLTSGQLETCACFGPRGAGKPNGTDISTITSDGQLEP